MYVLYNVNSKQRALNSTNQLHPFIDSRNIIKNSGTDVCWNRLAEASYCAGRIDKIFCWLVFSFLSMFGNDFFPKTSKTYGGGKTSTCLAI